MRFDALPLPKITAPAMLPANVKLTTLSTADASVSEPFTIKPTVSRTVVMTAPVSAPIYKVPFLPFPAAAAPAENALRKLSAEQTYPIMYSPQSDAFIMADAMVSRTVALTVHAAAALAAALPSKALLFADNKKNTSR